MERLTERDGNEVTLRGFYGGDFCGRVCKRTEKCEDCVIQEAFNKLAAYEDAEERDLLLRLTCEMVWMIVDEGTEYATVMPKSVSGLYVFEIAKIDIDGRYWSSREKAEAVLRGED